MINFDLIIAGLQGKPTPTRDVIKEVPVYPDLNDFQTFADLDAWFNLHTELQLPVPNLCDDYSRESRKLAETDGYYLSCELVDKGKCYETQIFWKDAAGNATIQNTGVPAVEVYHIANLAIVLSDETNLADGVNDKDSSGNILPQGIHLETCYYVDLNWNLLIKLTNFTTGGKY